MQQYKNTLILSLVAASLSACVSSRAPAPVSERGGAPSAGSAAEAGQAPAVARPGYYIVKPGENLYRIALEHGQDYKEIAAWNGLENPNVIQAGQELRVVPPENGVVTSPVTSSSGVEVRPIGASSSVEARPIAGAIEPAPAAAPTQAAAPAAGDTLKREPKGGKLPYSEQAWAQARKPEAAPASAQVRTESRRDAKSDTPAEPKSDKSAQIAESSRSNTAEDGVEWGWPGAGKVMTGFNDSSSKGLDLTGKTGDPVVAAAAGKVVYAGTALRGYGRLLIIKHGNNYSSVYAHNSQLLVKEGQQVKRGQKIAELGDTDSDRPKLHFEIRRQGKPVDPVKYLPNR